MSKPAGFVPGVQRYSADHPSGSGTITVLYLGVQCADSNSSVFHQFRKDSVHLFSLPTAPTLHDYANFVDPEGYGTQFAVAYWYNQADYVQWSESTAFKNWWNDEKHLGSSAGYFKEAFTCSLDHTETIAFKEYVRGLSACPMRAVQPMGESGYWGAARDRIPASAYQALDTTQPEPLTMHADRNTLGRHVKIAVPQNLTLIRSGVSWNDCGNEQLNSYTSNLKPALDAGMQYLRENPVETGCCCLRQVDVITEDNQATKENYCAGYFLSLGHLEQWAKNHPTHLAIYGRAQNERMKYKEKLELRTYHEVYVLDRPTQFEYTNCHNRTGLLPFFQCSTVAESATG